MTIGTGIIDGPLHEAVAKGVHTAQRVVTKARACPLGVLSPVWRERKFFVFLAAVLLKGPLSEEDPSGKRDKKHGEYNAEACFQKAYFQQSNEPSNRLQDSTAAKD